MLGVCSAALVVSLWYKLELVASYPGPGFVCLIPRPLTAVQWSAIWECEAYIRSRLDISDQICTYDNL